MFKSETSDREKRLIQSLRQAKKEYFALPDLNTKEAHGKRYLIHELTTELNQERKARKDKERIIRELNGDMITVRVAKAFKAVAILDAFALVFWLYLSGDIKAQAAPTGIMWAILAISSLFHYFGYICRRR